jgi:cobalt-zinc-cadmium efflux system outer membrane protein
MDMQYKWGKYFFLAALLFVVFSTAIPVVAQVKSSDTLRLTISQAEDIFLKQNLSLLANHYSVDINKALLTQAKLWDNPLLVTDQNIYDGKFFRHSKENGQQYGQIYMQIQQIIRTAGKIKKLSQLAKDNVLGAEAQFSDLMRNLKFILATDMNNLAQLQSIAQVYETEIPNMESLSKGMDEMLNQGDVSKKENLRIKALLFSLQNEYNENLRQQYDVQKELSGLLRLNESTWIIADADKPVAGEELNKWQLAALQDSAFQWRPDLQSARIQQTYQQHNISYQKALAKPDLVIGPEFDKLNSYVPNYVGLTISLPIPVFNRNKGNIEAADLSYKQSVVLTQQLADQVALDITNAWKKLIAANRLLDHDNTQLRENYDTLLQNMIGSYRQRQVGLVEFIDFFDAYKETRIKQGQLVAVQRNAAAELNYAIGKNIVSL